MACESCNTDDGKSTVQKLFNIELNGKQNIIRMIAGAVMLITGIVFDKVLHNSYISFIFIATAFLLLGFDIILRALGNLFKGQVFDENFLMCIASIGAFVIGEHPEAAGVMLFYQIGEYFQDMAVDKSKKSITNLMDIRPDYANLLKSGEIIKTSPDSVCIGDVIIVKPGEKIPLDGVVTDGTSLLDMSALTGESVPKKVNVKSEVLSGSVNLSGKLTIEVTKTFGESTVSKIINLVENAASKKAKTENFITRFARYYTPIVVILALLLAVLPPLIFTLEWKLWIYRALVFLVISCPCALVLSVPMGFFAGIGAAAKNGILVKGGNFLEAFNKLDTVVFDKTGTLTRGVFKVTSIQPEAEFTEDELLELAANAEVFSNHPIALSVMQEYGKDVEKSGLTEYTEYSGYGVSVIKNGKTILAGNQKMMKKMGIRFNESWKSGTKVYVAYNGIFAGIIVISDEVKPDSRNAIASLKERGVQKTVMLTGDNPDIAQNVASELEIDDVYGGLLPHEKVEILEKLIEKKNAKSKLAFVGDGINDAPVLSIADIGVAMGAVGSDAAIEAADMVLMTDEPSKLAQAVDISRFTCKIVMQNIIFSLSVKIIFLVFGAFGIAAMWEAVFADVGVCLLAILNCMRILKVKGNGK